jgi:hypothetical protein
VVKLSYYDQVGIVIPGALFLAIAALIMPGANALVAPQDISIGKFGIFLLLAYAAGHAVAAVGNILEFVWWSLRGGWPSDWIVYDDDRILNSVQKKQLLEKVNARLDLKVPKIVGLEAKKWRKDFGRLYGSALATNPGKIEVLNGNYGLNRGLASAAFALTIMSATIQPDQWQATAALGAGTLIYGFRAQLFGIGFAKEVYNCFLNFRDPLGQPL